MLSSVDFARYICVKAREMGIELNHTQLQKILYICDGFLLAYGINIVGENCCVWDYGPVYPKVYKWLYRLRAKSKPLDANFKPEFLNEIQATGADKVIEKALSRFGKISAVKLSEWSHQTGSPWHNTKLRRGMYSKIDKSEMASFFSMYTNGQS